MTNEELTTVAKALGAMFQCFPQSVLADPDLQVRGYIAAVKEFDARDILAACQRFMQADVKGHNTAFCPSSAQLCAEVRERNTIRRLRERKEGTVVELRPSLPASHFQNRIKQAAE